MIHFHANVNNHVAVSVLARVEDLVSAYDRKTRKVSVDGIITTQVYTNCREQGFALCSDMSKSANGMPIHDRQVVFAEFRRSDDIVVYTGTREDFERGTNIPNEDVYSNAKFFAHNEVRRAAQYIFDYLLGFTDENICS